jgi:hypothetical protein
MNAAGSLNNKRIKPITVYDHLFPEPGEKLQIITKDFNILQASSWYRIVPCRFRHPDCPIRRCQQHYFHCLIQEFCANRVMLPQTIKNPRRWL